jgi:hypothetical protein
MQANEVHAEPPEPLGDSGCVRLGREVRAEREVNSKQTDALIVGGLSPQVRAHSEEMPVTNEETVSRSERAVEKAEVRSATEPILIYRELVNIELSPYRDGCQQYERNDQGATQR